MWGGGGTYHEWAAFLERWAEGTRSDGVRAGAGAGGPGDGGPDGGTDGGTDGGAGLPRLVPDDFTPDAWARLTDRLVDAVSHALEAWATALTRAIAAGRDEFAVGRALVQSRDALRRIRALADHRALPAELRARLLEIVDGQVTSSQQDLERQAWRMRSDGVRIERVEARLRTLRDNPLTAVVRERAGAAEAARSWAAPPGARPRRTVIVDRRTDRTDG